jgi:hypothetical protein
MCGKYLRVMSLTFLVKDMVVYRNFTMKLTEMEGHVEFQLSVETALQPSGSSEREV